MADLQQQLEEMRRLWEDERQAKDRALLELDVIRSSSASVNMSMGANVQQVLFDSYFIRVAFAETPLAGRCPLHKQPSYWRWKYFSWQFYAFSFWTPRNVSNFI